MTVKDFEQMLAETDFCSGMDARHIRLLAEHAVETSFNVGEFVFREGEDAHRFYVIRAGKVSLEVALPERGEVVFQTLGEGDALGLSWLFPPFQWHFDARALEPTTMIRIDAAWLREKIEADCDFGFQVWKRLAKVMAGRLQATRLQMTDMYGSAKEPA